MYECNACKRAIVAPSAVASYENKYYHPDCLLCTVCNQTVSGKQFLKEKTGNLVCEECHAKTAPKCRRCGLLFAPGESYKKLDENLFFHNECFKCSGPCNKPIAAEFYDVEDGKFICVDCYDKYGLNFNQPAAASAAPDDNDTYNAPPPPLPFNAPPPSLPTSSAPQRINPNPVYDPSKLASDLNVNLTLNSKQPSYGGSNVEVLPAVQRDSYRNTPSQPASTNTNNNARPAAAAAAPSQPQPPAASNDLLCAKCNQKLTGTYTVYSEQKYHPRCFVCCQCSQEFKEKTFFKLNGNPLCRDCHNRNQNESATKCRKCSRPILDTVVTFKNGEYHDYCLVCGTCSKKLIGQSIYTDKQDRPFCVDCYTKKEAKYCAKCLKIIPPNLTNLVFEDKNYHKECFTCRDCKRIINSTESFYKGDENDSIICAACINK